MSLTTRYVEKQTRLLHIKVTSSTQHPPQLTRTGLTARQEAPDIAHRQRHLATGHGFRQQRHRVGRGLNRLRLGSCRHHGLRGGWRRAPGGWSCGPVFVQLDHLSAFGFGVQVVGPPLQQVGAVFQVGGSVVSGPHLIALFVG
jgi:hypothetical protein